ncbi:hypothetical protein ACGFZS_34920 [Streptomyces sp. NPDC048288]|uniref:hypothetical protein n=1 Tax=Streptomyces sp. NPDC048288 TaxID=3365529 RepID=UPI003714A982
MIAPGKVLTAAHVIEGASAVRAGLQADRRGERTLDATGHAARAPVDLGVLVTGRSGAHTSLAASPPHAVSVLAVVDPDAVRDVRDAVFAHLGLDDA